MLAASPDLTAIALDSEPVLSGMPALSPAERGWDSERLTGTDIVPQLAERVRAGFAKAAAVAMGTEPEEGAAIRVLDADPRNALRIPFLAAVFPQSIFVSVHREPAESLPAMLAAWESGEHVTRPGLPGWEGPPWSLLLTPEWRNLAGRPLPELVAEQWAMATRILLADLERMPPARWCVVDLAILREDPAAEIERICEFAGVEPPETVSPAPAAGGQGDDAGRAAEIEAVIGRTDELAARAREWIAQAPDGPEAAPERAGRPELPDRLAAAQRQQLEPGRHPRPARQLADDHHLPDGQARGDPPRRQRGEHALPAVREPDGPRLAGRAARDRHPLADLRVPQRAEPAAEDAAARQARRLLRAAALPLHGRHPHPRRGVRRRRALVRRHPLLLPGDARRRAQLRAALAAAVRLRPRRRGPLPPERALRDRRRGSLRHGARHDRRGRRVA